ncbi:phasin family protein [Paraburkholderia sp. MPAMCS5]|uniref:phasin family protein n=1 Tax=Paraburkholderia sp. MPAMCS5 TaxID=3112563 RepID=UPI002E174340|nr:phasin family protein [Paraburkholderia sp. MPAMCS5]
MQMPFTLSVPISALQVTGQQIGALCALTRLNIDTCRSTVSGAMLHCETQMRVQTPEQFVRSQAEVVPWLARRFAGYTRAWMEIASEATSPHKVAHNHHKMHASRGHCPG